ncbi:MAG: FAD-binding protein [bacterium]|jgi:glycolate oxidase
MAEHVVSLLKPLKARFGGRLIFETESFPDYARDASEIKVRPPAIIFADTEEEVIEIINFCHAEKIPIVFRGAGTGYTGGAVPVENGLVLSLEHLKKLEIIPEKRIGYCGPGVITIDLMKAAEKHRLFYPPDPASYDESTLGGNVAECAGGLHCKKYGVTKDYVLGLKAVTIEGELLKTGIYSNGELFDITGVLIGSEGLLAAVTEIAVSLIDLPRKGATILAAFDHAENAARVVSEVTRRGIVPAVMEYMDGDSAACSNQYEKALELEKTEALLLFETTGDDADKQSDEIMAICRKHHSILLRRETDEQKAEQLWRIRRNLSKAVKASAEQKISEDVAVPPSKLSELVSFVAQLNAEYPVRINAYGHAGDGNLHVNFLVEAGKPDYSKEIEEGINRLFDKTLALGGTLTGEHGIGLTKRRFLPREFDTATLGAMKAVKEVFDPYNLLNPGKMF